MQSEVHIKIGGDHGGKSFKFAYQIANLEKPNSVRNSTVFNIFEAKDIRSNLDLVCNQFARDIVDLEKEKIL